MNRIHGWKVGTIRNVQLYLHFSLVILLFYVVLVASVQLPYIAAQSGVKLADIHGTPILWGALFAVSLLVSIVLHEFGHVIVAQALGTKVRSITLMMLGGVSQMDRLPETRYAELKVSIVGPLVSFAIAALLFLVRALTNSPDIALYSYWLGLVNLTLAVFNLLPAFPMDGGRVLRSILSGHQGKLRGTRNAVRVSQVFAWIFGIAGFLQFNLLLILIAVFIYGGAKSELFTLVAKSLLKGVRAGEVGKRVEAITDQMSLERASELMVKARCLVLPVRTAAGGVAIVSSEQIKRVPRAYWPEVPVRNVMWEISQGVDVQEPLDETLEQGMLSAVGGIPLLQGGEIVGVLRNSDLAEWIEIRSLERGVFPQELAA